MPHERIRAAAAERIRAAAAKRPRFVSDKSKVPLCKRHMARVCKIIKQ
jgi:hypothetical protein